ncbi:hypothetical protein D3C78_1645420 [compost metagenome]
MRAITIEGRIRRCHQHQQVTATLDLELAACHRGFQALLVVVQPSLADRLALALLRLELGLSVDRLVLATKPPPAAACLLDLGFLDLGLRGLQGIVVSRLRRSRLCLRLDL